MFGGSCILARVSLPSRNRKPEVAKSALEPPPASPTFAAESAAVAAIGPATRCLELPKAA